MSRRLLVVDDDPAIRRVLREIFVRDGFEVWAAEGGEAGLAQVAAGEPDLVILDLEMPTLDASRIGAVRARKGSVHRR